MAYKRSALMEERLAGARERILLATRALVAAGGYRNAPVTAVAAEAGVSTGLIYRHFPSKAELFVEVLTAAVAHELRIFEAIAAEPLPAPERLRRAITAFVRRALAGPGLAYAFIAEPVDPEVEAERIRCRRRFGDVFRRILADGSPKRWSGRPRPAAMRTATRTRWSRRSAVSACAPPAPEPRRCCNATPGGGLQSAADAGHTRPTSRGPTTTSQGYRECGITTSSS